MTVSVVLCQDGSRIEQFAANDLARYLSRMSGADVPVCGSASAPAICLCVTTDDPELRPLDSFRISESDGVVTIHSAAPRGLLMGAYHYLQLLGCRFYFPGEANEVVPRRHDVILRGVEAYECPAFEKRGIVIYLSNDAFLDWVDFMPKAKLNTIGVHAFIEPGGGGRGTIDDASQAEDLTANRGLRIDLEAHCFGSVFCPSDEEGASAAAGRLVEMVKRLPSSTRDLFLWQADGHIEKCDCPEHQQHTPSDQTLLLANHLLAAARSARPDAKLCYLAYINTLAAPRNVKPADGVFLEWAPIRRCMSHALNDPACAINEEGHVPHLLDNLEVFGTDDAQVLGYWLDASLFNRGRFDSNGRRLPFFPHLIRDDLQYYRSLGIKQITTFACQLDRSYFGTFVSPSVSAYAQLLWNPNADYEPELKLFCRNFFDAEEALVGLVPDTAVDPQHCPGAREVGARIADAIPVVQALAQEATNELCQERLLRLAAELEHRLGWCGTALEHA